MGEEVEDVGKRKVILDVVPYGMAHMNVIKGLDK